MNPLIQWKKTTLVFFVRSLLGAATASLLMIAPSAQAGYIVTLKQVGPNVVATGSGAIDVTGLSLFAPNGFEEESQIGPDAGIIGMGPTSLTFGDGYTGAISGPTNFGSGGGTFASSGSGDFVFIEPVGLTLAVPVKYVSGTALSDTSTYDNATFASLGVTPGTYEWTWGTGANQNFTLKAGTAVPDSGSTISLVVMALTCLFGVSRFRSFRLA